MHDALISVLKALRSDDGLDAKGLDALLRSFNKKDHDRNRRISKRRLLSFYMNERREESDFFLSLNVSESDHDKIISLLRAKPRRTASGVATVSVLMMPWPCEGHCVYCPNDILMPKSYMRDEPACQRALRCFFDPYLQVASRVLMLEDMGHCIDKVELIVLGGTFSDYPKSYREWFTKEMFRALNDAGRRDLKSEIAQRRQFYIDAGLNDETSSSASELQNKVDLGEIGYNDAVEELHKDGLWKVVESLICENPLSIKELHADNENAGSRNVGLVFETRPECATPEHLKELRGLGATKIQIGIQSLDDETLGKCARASTTDQIAKAFKAMRAAGLKSHVHYMINLPGSSPTQDISIWDLLVNDERFKPDEVKVYPCALVESASMTEMYKRKTWSPYTDDELMDVLVHCLETAPTYMRISRMIRDICSNDIIAGNKRTNLRQMVEDEAKSRGLDVQEMRFREIGLDGIGDSSVHISDSVYETDGFTEHFCQCTSDTGRLIAFCRVSVPKDEDHAMIRELHVYGKVAGLGDEGAGAQHKGLGRELIKLASRIARDNDKESLWVISAIGTRHYYRQAGFHDDGLYQKMEVR